MTLGVGQFCTNPGLIFVHQDSVEIIADKTAELIAAGGSATMLNAGIYSAFGNGLDALEKHSSITTLAKATTGEGSNQAAAVLFQTTAEAFLQHRELTSEVFGPATIIITYRDDAELATAIQSLDGQLTASVHGTDADLADQQSLVHLMEDRAGRVVFNAFPTGVQAGKKSKRSDDGVSHGNLFFVRTNG